jgi:hypothetical protein
MHYLHQGLPVFGRLRIAPPVDVFGYFWFDPVAETSMTEWTLEGIKMVFR